MPLNFSKKPITVNFCIDYRYDSLGTDFLNAIGLNQNYYLATTAGASLPFGYKKYCCKKCCTDCCNPNNCDIKLLKKSLVKNIDITEALSDIKDIYLVNHQDCGAFKAYLECSGYPNSLGENNAKEIKINEDVLKYSKEYLKCKYPNKNIYLGLIDINGTVADYIPELNKWELIYTGSGTNPLGLWWSYFPTPASPVPGSP